MPTIASLLSATEIRSLKAVPPGETPASLAKTATEHAQIKGEIHQIASDQRYLRGLLVPVGRVRASGGVGPQPATRSGINDSPIRIDQRTGKPFIPRLPNDSLVLRSGVTKTEVFTMLGRRISIHDGLRSGVIRELERLDNRLSALNEQLAASRQRVLKRKLRGIKNRKR